MAGHFPTRRVELVAMAPSGETFVARDGAGVLRLYSPAQAPRVVEEEIVERAILAGFDRVGESFTTWAELESARQRRASVLAPSLTTDVSDWDDNRVARALGVVNTWITDGKIAAARRVLYELLRAPGVQRSPATLNQISNLLQRCERREVVHVPTDPPDELKAAARERMLLAA